MSKALTPTALMAVMLTGAQFANAQTAPTPTPSPATSATAPDEEETIVLSPFTVDAEKDTGYQATSTLAGTRLKTSLSDVGSSISVLTKEFLTDVGGYNNQTVLAYALNTEVSGPRGNFSGANRNGSEGHITEPNNFGNPNGNTRVRGLTNADNTRDFFLSNIPWDGYNISRVDLQRGPNAILFGLGSPAGIVNAATNTASFRNKGSIEFLTDEFGTYRGSVDYNYNLINKQLALRVALLDNHQRFQQAEAFRNDRRGFATTKFAPAALNKEGMLFEVSANIEHGEIDSNNPRSIPPEDQFTPFWKPLAEGGLDSSKTFNVFLDTMQAGQDEFKYDNSAYRAFGPGAQIYANANGVPMYQDRRVGNYGARNKDGSIIGLNGTEGGPTWGNQRSDMYVIRPVQQWAAQANPVYSSVGAYRNDYLTDTSVFDFYNHLIDGPNKHESSRWNAWTVDLTNTFFNNMFGYNVTVYDERVKSSNWTALGWEGNAIKMDINEYLPDGSKNPNLGRPYVSARTGNGAYSNDSHRRAYRGQAFVEYDFARRHNDVWWARILGSQRVSGVLTDEDQKQDSRNIDLFDYDLATRAWFGANRKRSGDNKPDGLAAFQYYIGPDIRGKVNGRGANLGGVNSTFIDWVGGPSPISYFDNTWIAGPGVDPGAPWDTATGYPGAATFGALDPNHLLHGSYTQSNNPANYRGWTTATGNVVTFMSPGIVPGTSQTAEQYLTNSATLSSFRVKSKVGVWQGTFWNHSIVGIVGIRQDKARNYYYNSNYNNRNVDPITGAADVRPSTYNWSNPTAAVDTLSSRTKNWSVMAHVNQLVPGFDPLPFNIRLYYNRGENLQPLAGRTDMLGRALPPPSGRTTERSIAISTKDDRYSLKLTKFRTTIKDSTSTDSEIGALWALQQTLGFDQTDGSPAGIARLYKLGLRDPYTNDYKSNGGDPDRLLNSIVPAWLQFEKDLRAKFPELITAWFGKDTIFGTDKLTGPNPVATRPPGSVFTEDSTSEGYELEFTANPTKNWRIALNASKTEAVRDNVPGSAFKDVAAYIDDKIQNTDVGLMPMWWPGNGQGLRKLGPYAFFYRPEYLKVLALNGQSAGEIRKYRGSLVTSYDFDEGRLKGFGVGGAVRYEDKSVIGYAPIKDAQGFYKVNVNAPFYAPSDTTYDAWISYRRKLSDKINWRIQLNVFNVGGKNKLVPIAAGVDRAAVISQGLTDANVKPDTKVPMKATGFSIKEGMSWQISNTFEF